MWKLTIWMWPNCREDGKAVYSNYVYICGSEPDLEFINKRISGICGYECKVADRVWIRNNTCFRYYFYGNGCSCADVEKIK